MSVSIYPIRSNELACIFLLASAPRATKLPSNESIQTKADGSAGPSMGHGGIGCWNGERRGAMESEITVDSIFRGQIVAAEPLRGGAVFRWESTTAGVLVLAALGCNAPVPMEVRQVDNLVHLGILAGANAIVGYRGCDKDSHFFSMPDGRPCAIPRSRWNVSFLPVTLGLCLPLSIVQGELTVPPQQWSMKVQLASLQWTIDH